MPEGSTPLLASGVFAALATPRRSNSIEADTASLLEYLDAIAATGVSGLVLFGSTGEFIHFEIGERMRAAGLAIKRSRVPVLVNASHSTLAGALSLAEQAVASGAAGVMLTPPYFFLYSDDQIFEFYSQFADAFAAAAPVYIYNLAPFLNPIRPELSARLLKTGAFAGIKDSSGDWSQFEQLSALRKELPFQLLAGHEKIYARARAAGADGIISGVSAAVPELVVTLDRAIASGNAALTATLEKRLDEFVAYVLHFPSTLAIRQAGAVRGWSLSQTAVPMDEDTASEVIRFHAWFREWLPVVLAECGVAEKQ